MQFLNLALFGSLLAVIQAAPSSKQTTLSLSDEPVCFKICYFQKPKCPRTMNARRFGDCWTCCLKDKDENLDTADPAKDLITEEVTILNGLEMSLPSDDMPHEVCLLPCWPQENKCATHWYAQKFGECWTCCRKISTIFDAEKPKTLQAPVKTNEDITIDVSINVQSQDTRNDVCWAACFPEKPNCAPAGTATNFGECWTCCFPANYAVSSIDAEQRMVEKEDYSLLFNEEDSAEICWRSCFLRRPRCPANLRAQKHGKCWTCCSKNNEEEL